MKAFALSAVLSALLYQSAAAQSYYCSRPSEPMVPSGHFSERWDMEMAAAEVESYQDEMRDYLDCLKRESQDAVSEYEDILDEWRRAVSDYNLKVQMQRY